MDETGWYLDRIDTPVHAIPYVYLEEGESLAGLDLRLAGANAVIDDPGFVPLCLYSFFNYPDGLVRTSPRELARFLIAHMGDGSFEGARILSSDSVASIWVEQPGVVGIHEDLVQGLTWVQVTFEDFGPVWGHTGGDPGITTSMLFSKEKNMGVIVFANSNTRLLGTITQRLLQAAR